MTDLSIVIVSYNTRGLLRDCLDALAAGTCGIDFETWVVDNASSDGSAEMVAEHFSHVRLIRNQENRGFAAANNLALEQSSGRYLVILNPDTVVGAGALAELVGFMDAHEEAGYCGPRLVNGDGSHQPSARRFPTLLSTSWSMLGWDVRHPDSRHCSSLHLQQDDRAILRADWLTGACLLVRRTALEKVGLLDDGFFMYFEETDWCRRLANAGWAGWYVGSAEVKHLGGQSLGPRHADAPFFGNHPGYWVASRRRYLRRHHGLAGWLAAETLEVSLNMALWLKHSWRGTPESRQKARRAGGALRYLAGRRASSRR